MKIDKLRRIHLACFTDRQDAKFHKKLMIEFGAN